MHGGVPLGGQGPRSICLCLQAVFCLPRSKAHIPSLLGVSSSGWLRMNFHMWHLVIAFWLMWVLARSLLLFFNSLVCNVSLFWITLNVLFSVHRLWDTLHYLMFSLRASPFGSRSLWTFHFVSSQFWEGCPSPALWAAWTCSVLSALFLSTSVDIHHCWFCLPDLLCACLMQVRCVSFQLFLQFHISRLSLFFLLRGTELTYCGLFVWCGLLVLKLWPWRSWWWFSGLERNLSRCGWLRKPCLTVAVSCLKQLWPWKLKDCWAVVWLTEVCVRVAGLLPDRSSRVAPVSIHKPTLVPSSGLEDAPSSCSRAMTTAAWHREGANSCSSSSWIMCGLQLHLL